MLDIMYELPSIQNVKECVITEDVVTKNAKPEFVYGAPDTTGESNGGFGKKAENA